jgi:hypothetical protein
MVPDSRTHPGKSFKRSLASPAENGFASLQGTHFPEAKRRIPSVPDTFSIVTVGSGLRKRFPGSMPEEKNYLTIALDEMLRCLMFIR